MTYVSASHIEIKKGQDYASCIIQPARVVLCDGIGQYEGSGMVAEYVTNEILHGRLAEWKHISDTLKEISEDVRTKNLVGGTTLLCGEIELVDGIEVAKLVYLGNGGIVHAPGNFAKFREGNSFYLYNDLFLPHVDVQKRLTRHISHNSGIIEVMPICMNLPLARAHGDVLLLYTDGIGSLENQVVLQDELQRYWRHENPNVQYILQQLDSFLSSTNLDSDFQSQFATFSSRILNELKAKEALSDDASLGIIISSKVIQYYSSLKT